MASELPIRNIIFDIGRVLVGLNIPKAQAGLAKGLPLSPEELWSAIERDPHWQDWQEGRMLPHDWHINLCRRLGVSLDFEEFTRVWNDALELKPIHANSLFATLSKNYKLGLLSNTDPIHVAYMERTFEFFRYFPPGTRTYSCVAGCSKPNPLIFREALRACKARAEETVYVDDIPAFIDAAQQLGLRGVAFKSPDQMRADLTSLGVQF